MCTIVAGDGLPGDVLGYVDDILEDDVLGGGSHSSAIRTNVFNPYLNDDT